MAENTFYGGELQDHTGATFHPKTVAGQVYHSDGKTTEAKIEELLAQLRNQATAAAATYFNRATGDNVTGPVSTMSWGTFSAGTSGIAVIAENAYIDKDKNTYHYKNNHSSLGARGIVLHPTQGILWFDTGAVATTAGTQFSPVLRSIQAGQTAGMASGDMNNLVDTGFYNGSQMANAPGVGWYYVICIGHSHDAGNYRLQIAFPFEGSSAWFRVCYAGTWHTWMHIITSYGGNINGMLNLFGNGAPLSLFGEDHVYIPIYKNGAAGARSGYLGYGDGADANFTISNEVPGGAIKLLSAKGLAVYGGLAVDGVQMPKTYISPAEPTADQGAEGDVWLQYV